MSRDTREISFTDVLRLFDESTHIVECLPGTSAAQCQQEAQCDIQRPLEVLNGVILKHLENLSLAVFFASGTFTATKDLSINSVLRPAVRD